MGAAIWAIGWTSMLTLGHTDVQKFRCTDAQEYEHVDDGLMHRRAPMLTHATRLMARATQACYTRQYT